jgi:hypothetical protein
VTEVGFLAHYLHLSASLLVVGSAALLLLAGRSDRATALRWQARVVAVIRALTWLGGAARGGARAVPAGGGGRGGFKK